MTRCRRSALAGAARFWIVLPIVAIGLSATGCGGGGGELGSPSEGLQAVETVAFWYQRYRVKNGGKVPPDEEAFLSFIESDKKNLGETLDRDKFLTSPRDKQKFVIVYGKPILVDGQNLAAYEKEGDGGKKLIGVESEAYVRGREIDDAALQKLIAGK